MDHLLLEFGVRALLVASGTAVVLRVARVRAASVRHAAWTAVLIVMLVLPVWTLWGPRVSLKLLPVANSVETATEVAVPKIDATVTTPVSAVAASAAPSTPESSAWNLRRAVIALYVVVTGVLLFRLFLGTLRAQLLIRGAVMRDGLLTSASCASPLTVGWFRPVAILPEEWHSWPQGQLDAVLTHEREHVRRHDPLVQWLALLNRAVFWFHPLSWWLERHLSQLAEEACDAAVLAKGHSAQDYSEYLLQMADSVMQAGRRVSLVGMHMPGSFLTRRIPRLFDGRSPLRVSRTRLACAAIAFAISTAAFAGTVVEARESQPVAVTSIRVAPTLAPVRVEVTSTAAPLELVAAQVPVLTPQASVSTPQQIQIDARIVVANRSFTRDVPAMAITRNIGLGGKLVENGVVLLLQPGSENQLDEILATGEARGLLRMSSRPKVTTVNGGTAEISQGTQIPVQTNVNGTVTTSFLTFALTIDVTPQITESGLLVVSVSVENSQPDFARAVNGVPAISTGSSKTNFLVKDGTTVMINNGVLTQSVANSQTRQVPGLGTIPIIGTLFRDQAGQAASPESDLLLFITPRIKVP